MEVYQLRVFLEVARQLSFTEAGDTLNLTQPAISAKIKSLESELGTPLFYRLGRKIQLTDVGHFLFEAGPKLIQVENQLLQKIEEIKQGKFGHLRIGCTAAIAAGWLPDVIFEYRQQYPNIQTHCLVFDSAEFLYRAVTSNQVNLGVSDISFEDFSEIASMAIDTINYSLFVSTTHPLAKQNWLSLKELKTYPWVLLPSGSPSRLIFEARLAELGLSIADFTQLETVDTISLMRTYIAQGHLGFASNLEYQLECQSRILLSIPLQEFALSGKIYLLSPKRLGLFNNISSNHPDRRSPSLNPSQKFIALVQARSTYSESSPQGTELGIDAINISAHLRSPDFTIRSTNHQRSETLTLSVGIQNGTIPAVTAGLIIQRLSLLEHFLPRNGRYGATQYQIRWCDFPTGAPIVERLRSSQLDIGILGDYPLLLSAMQPDQANFAKTRLVSFVSTNPDGSCNAVIVPNQSKFETLEDLRGRVIAVPFSSSAHGMVMRSLNSANLLSEVELTSLEHPSSSNLFEFPVQFADSYAHFTPFHDIACRRGKFRYLLGSDQKTLPAFYGVVVSRKLAEQHPEVVIAYLKALNAAQYWYDTTSAAPALVSQWTRLETEVVVQILSSSYQTNQPRRFFSEMSIRPDWLDLHVAQLSQIPGNESLKAIDLGNWIQPEFLHQLGA